MSAAVRQPVPAKRRRAVTVLGRSSLLGMRASSLTRCRAPLPAVGSRLNGDASGGFTMVELLVAIVVLTVVFLIVGAVMTQLRRTVSLAAAQNDVATQAAAIEKTLREDIRRMTRDGFLVIRNETAIIADYPVAGVNTTDRSDRLTFFATGPWTSVRITGGNTGQTFQANVARITVGHAAPALLGRHQLLLTPEGVPTAGMPDNIWHLDIPPGLWDIAWNSDMMSVRQSVMVGTLLQQQAAMSNAAYPVNGRQAIDRNDPLLTEQFYLTSNVLAANNAHLQIEFAGDYNGFPGIDRVGDADADINVPIKWYGVGTPTETGVDYVDMPTQYVAVFGYDHAATPWPRLIRVTIDLHDRGSGGDPPRLYEQFLNDGGDTIADPLQGARRFRFVFALPE